MLMAHCNRQLSPLVVVVRAEEEKKEALSSNT
jgi:hypothetical protein